MIVGLVSDTHGRFDPALPGVLRGCDLILHAGDVGGHEILHQLGALAPVQAVRGNTDAGEAGQGLEDRLLLQVGGLRLLLLHDVGAPERFHEGCQEGLDVVVSGHSHQPGVRLCGATLFVNPGSAGPRRFRLPRSAGVMRVEGPRVRVELFDLDRPGLPHLAPPFEAELAPVTSAGRAS